MIDASKNRKKRTGAAMGSSLLCFPGTGVTSVEKRVVQENGGLCTY